MDPRALSELPEDILDRIARVLHEFKMSHVLPELHSVTRSRVPPAYDWSTTPPTRFTYFRVGSGMHGITYSEVTGGSTW